MHRAILFLGAIFMAFRVSPMRKVNSQRVFEPRIEKIGIETNNAPLRQYKG
jgi:hypothetical protein